MIESNLPALIAICKCFKEHDEALSVKFINATVFYSMADVKQLKPFIKEMKKDGLLTQVYEDRYTLAGSGRTFLERENKG